MSEIKAGITHIITVMETVLAVGSDIAGSLTDGKLTLSETLALSKHIPGALSAIKAAPDLPAELSDLDEDERAQIIAHFADKFTLPNDELELRVERLFGIAVNLSEQIVETVGLVKAFRSKE
jgi:hypothetical protein